VCCLDSGSHCSHILVSIRPNSLETYHSGPVPSENCSAITTRVEQDGNWEVGLWECLPAMSRSLLTTINCRKITTQSDNSHLKVVRRVQSWYVIHVRFTHGWDDIGKSLSDEGCR